MSQLLPPSLDLGEYQSGLFQVQGNAINAYSDLLTDPIDRMMSQILRSSTPQGKIDPDKKTALLEKIGNIITSVFSDGRETFDRKKPLTPFASFINQHIALASLEAAKPHYTLLKTYLDTELLIWLSGGRTVEQVSIGNDISLYPPPHEFVDPAGYRLADRVWRLGQTTRIKLDQMLSDAIEQGQSATELATHINNYLLPGHEISGLSTKGYGTNVSYHATTLIRSEVSSAHSMATLGSTNADPFTSGIDWKFSIRHIKSDDCDRFATLDASGHRIKPPYSVIDAPIPVRSTHPGDLCYLVPSVTETDQVVTQYLSDLKDNRKPAPLTPYNLLYFLIRFIGIELVNPILGDISAFIA